MAVQIARGARSAWRNGHLVFRVQSKVGRERLQAVVADIWVRLIQLDSDEESGPKFISDVLVLPDGVAFWLDAPDASASMADRIVANIVAGLEEAGIQARLSGGSRGLRRARGPQVQMAAVPGHPPAREAVAVVPWDDIGRVLDWALEDATAHVVVESGGVHLDLPRAATRAYVRYLHRLGRSCYVLADGTSGRRGCSIAHPADERGEIQCPHLGLSWSGAAVQADIDAAFEATVAWARTIGHWATTVHVTVHPDAHDLFLIRPPWGQEVPGPTATLALSDHVLDAYPWQRLKPSQAELLPDPLHRLVTYDAATAELRMGRLDDWLREPATIRRDDFARAMRSMLGRALATRDVAWARSLALPASWPRPPDERAPEEPEVDLGTVPIFGYTRAHPSLGVTPPELLSLRRGGLFHDVVDLSRPLRYWLNGLAAASAPEENEPIRQIVAAFVDADVGARHALVHMFVLEEWLVHRLTPALVEAAGLGDADVLRRQLPPPSAGKRPQETVAVLLEVLAHVVAHDPEALGRNTYDHRAARTTDGIAHITGWASCLGRPRGDRDAFASVSFELKQLLWEGTAFDDRMARSLWRTGARAVGSEAVAEAYERARVTDSRFASRWLEAEEPGGWPPVAFAQAAAAAVHRTDDPDAAWDLAVELGAAVQPDFGTELIATLTDRLPAPVIDAGWATARRTLASIHYRTRLAAANAASAATAAMLCRLAVGAAAAVGRADETRDVTWGLVDQLVHDLTTTAS